MTIRRPGYNRALVSLGSNLGRRASSIFRALTLLDDDPSTSVLRRSRIYVSRPIGGDCDDQLPYFNSAAVLSSRRDPRSLLDLLLHVERRLARRRTRHWGSRTIDLDLLLYRDRILRSHELTIPHPRMTWRRFVLLPAAEIAPEMIHPAHGVTVRELLARITDRPQSVVVAGRSGSEARAVALRLVEKTGGRAGAISWDKWAGIFLPEPIQFHDIEITIVDLDRTTSADSDQPLRPRLFAWIGRDKDFQAVAQGLNCPAVQMIDPNDAQGFEELQAAVEGIRDTDAAGRPMVEPL